MKSHNFPWWPSHSFHTFFRCRGRRIAPRAERPGGLTSSETRSPRWVHGVHKAISAIQTFPQRFERESVLKNTVDIPLANHSYSYAIFICVHKYIYIYTIYLYLHLYIYIYLFIYILTFIFIFTFIFTFTIIFIFIYIYPLGYLFIYLAVDGILMVIPR